MIWHFSAVPFASARFCKTEAAMAPDLNKVNGRHAPRGCRVATGGKTYIIIFVSQKQIL